MARWQGASSDDTWPGPTAGGRKWASWAWAFGLHNLGLCLFLLGFVSQISLFTSSSIISTLFLFIFSSTFKYKNTHLNSYKIKLIKLKLNIFNYKNKSC